MPDDDIFAPANGSDETEEERPRTLEERAAAAAGVDLDEGEQGELFSDGLIHGDEKVTIKSLIKPGDKVVMKVDMGGKANLPLRGGLLNPNKEVRLLVRCWASEYREKVTAAEQFGDGTRKIEEWTVRSTLKVNHVENIGGWQEGIRKLFVEGMSTSATDAGKALEELQAMFTDYMTTGIIDRGPLG